MEPKQFKNLIRNEKRRNKKKEEEELFIWCLQQAKNYKEKKLSKEQLKKLKEIKFPFKFYLKQLKEMQKSMVKH